MNSKRFRKDDLRILLLLSLGCAFAMSREHHDAFALADALSGRAPAVSATEQPVAGTASRTDAERQQRQEISRGERDPVMDVKPDSASARALAVL
ncbi:hypothetical protein CKO23_23290 [Thiocystis violacea]|nr:hypothetical protein [Thiocystis violacea]